MPIEADVLMHQLRLLGGEPLLVHSKKSLFQIGSCSCCCPHTVTTSAGLPCPLGIVHDIWLSTQGVLSTQLLVTPPP